MNVYACISIQVSFYSKEKNVLLCICKYAQCRRVYACISIQLSFNSKKRMCYYAYTSMHHNAEWYMHTTHTSTHISYMIINLKLTSPMDYSLTYYATQLRPCGSHFQLSNRIEPASLVLLSELVWYCSRFA